MELDIDSYFWLVDRGLLDDNPKNKVFLETNKVKLRSQDSHQMENGIIIAQTMSLLRKSIMKISKKPFALDPQLNHLKDNAAEKIKSENWNIITRELVKFGIKVNSERKQKILLGKHLPINEILNALYEFDNGGMPRAVAQQQEPLESIGSEINPKELVALDSEKESVDLDRASPNLEKSQNFSPKHITAKKSPLKTLPTKKKGDVMKELEFSGKEPAQAENILEFILLTLSKALEMTPNQAAGLLSNQQKYLMLVCVKGLKGEDFGKLLFWYQELWVAISHFIKLLEQEVEQGQVKACLNIIKTGLFSQNVEVVIWCARFLVKLGTEINKLGNFLSGEAWDWFTDSSKQIKHLREAAGTEVKGSYNDSGLSAALYAMKAHQSEVQEHIVFMCHQFGQNNFLEMFTHHLPSQLEGKIEYISTVLDFFHSGLSSTQLANECFFFSGVLDHWLDFCMKMAEYDGVNSLEERCLAVVFLVDTWITKPDFIDNRPEMANNILTILKRSCRDKDKLLRVLSYEQIFRAFSEFAKQKIQHAPVIYKSIAFLLVEYHMDIEAREQMIVHFSQIFTELPMIPVAIAVEPLVKQIQMSEGYTFFWNIFDLDFFATISHHKRLSSNLGVQLLNLLSNVALKEVTFASYSVSILCQLYERFQRDPLFNSDLIRISHERALEPLFKLEKERKRALQLKKKREQAQLKEKETIKQNSKSKRALQKEMQEIEIRDYEAEEEFNRQHSQRLLQEKLIGNFLYRLSNLSLGIVREELQNKMLFYYTELQKKDKIQSKMLKWLLKIFDKNVDNLIKFYQANVQHPEFQRQETGDDFDQYGMPTGFNSKEDSEARSMVPFNHKLGSPPRRGIESETLSIKDPVSLKPLDKYQEMAMRDIQKIKRNNKQKEEQEQLERELDLMKKEKQRSQARKQVEQRIISLGHGDRIVKRDDYSGVRSESQVKKQRGISAHNSKGFRIVDLKQNGTEATSGNRRGNMLMNGGIGDSITDIGLSEVPVKLSPEQKKEKYKYNDTEIEIFDISLEEKQDQLAVKVFMKKNLRIFKALFHQYSNSVASGQHQKSFDAVQAQARFITAAEALKMLKDYGMQPQYQHSRNLKFNPVTKDIVLGLMRGVNTKIMPQQNQERAGSRGAMRLKNSKLTANLGQVLFEGFLEFVQQVAWYCYKDKYLHKPPVEYVILLLEQFKSQAGRHRSEKLFEDPDFTTVGDVEVLRELNKRVKEDPYFDLPEDYIKVPEKEVSYVYEMPPIPCYDSQKIAIEVLDQMMHDMLGFHFLEP